MLFEQEQIGIIDLGTTSVRFIIFDTDFNICCSRSKQIKQFYPKPGWVNEDPVEIWDATVEAISSCLKESVPGQLIGIGICNQRESTMVWDKKTGEALSELIVWQDRRTASRCAELKNKIDPNMINKKTGLLLDPYFSATKLEWILSTKPELKKSRTLAFGTLDSWIIFKLTGQHKTDISNASRTMLFNINDFKWDGELLDIFGVNNNILPEVHNNYGNGIFGNTYSDSVFGRKIPICAVFGDQQSALFGQMCFNEGDSKSTFGTGSFLMMNTGRNKVESKNNLLSTVFFQDNSGRVYYALEGSTYNSGSIFQWLKEEMGLIKDYSEIEKYAQQTGYQESFFLVPGFTGLGAPFWDPYARGLIIGIERSTGKSQIIRAALEAAAYSTMDVMSAMKLDTGMDFNFLKIDGGLSRNKVFGRILSDITGTKVIKFSIEELTSLGACFGAALGLGLVKNPAELKDNRKEESFLPGIDKEFRSRLYSNWTMAVQKSRNWIWDLKK
jgi:glycerol kinase